MGSSLSVPLVERCRDVEDAVIEAAGEGSAEVVELDLLCVDLRSGC
jgi:hypothetical protein